MQRKKPLIMGILNVTPDSFSDGGAYLTPTKAVKRVREMEKEGADIIDVGGESTGPGSKRVSLAEELERVIPIITKIRKITKLPISVDTYKSEVARQALEAGANVINDVTALRSDRKMVDVVAKADCMVVLMYAKDSTPRTTKKKMKYKDVMKTVSSFLAKRIAYATKHGVKRSNIILDPGMGTFVSALPEYSYEIIARLDELKDRFKLPILLGPSRKSFLGGKIEERLERGIAASCLAYLNGASIIRTHDVSETREALDAIC